LVTGSASALTASPGSATCGFLSETVGVSIKRHCDAGPCSSDRRICCHNRQRVVPQTA
jgi:hypothetical protein